MRRANAPVAAAEDSAASRLLGWLPALLLAQSALSLWAASRALPAGGWSLPVVAVALGNQLLFLLRALPILLPLGWLLAALGSPRVRWVSVGVLWSLFLLLEAALEQYYLTARTPLGADLFGYSTAEIRTTLGGAALQGMGTGGWLGALLPLLLLWVGMRWCARRAAWPQLLPALVLAGVMAWGVPPAVGVRGLAGDAARDIATSKGAYFVADSLRWWRAPQSVPATALPLVAAGMPAASAGAAAQDPDYPFLHPDATPDALGPYFGPTRSGRPPNLVVIVVEGLGRSFSGPGAPLGSFTPFLDELAGRSLYFENFMANQGRTFGVLPALFGSLPVAAEGFAALGPKMPAHAGLFNVLRRQGYHDSFYSGTDASFDNERAFLQLQEVERIVDLRSFGPGYQRNPFSEWGYPDHELISRVLADNKRLRPPFVLGIQTISMHTAYAFPGQAAYRRRVAQRLDALGIPEARRGEYRAHADIYSAILYTDDQLRRYFEGVKNAPWYADTLFVITGDHRLAELPQDTHIERYHVPLIVFSPLLRKPARIRAVSSHLDVTPSLLALLSGRYGLKRPAMATWTGGGLDMGETFRSRSEFPLKQTKTSVPDFVAGGWFLHADRVYQLQDGMRASEVEDERLRMQVAQRLQAYLAANAVFLRKLALSPEGGMPKLVAYAATPAPAPSSQVTLALPMLPAGLSLDDVRLEPAADGVQVIATFANGDGVDSRPFMPLAVLTGEDGRELGEGYGGTLLLHPGERREVLLALRAPGLAAGRYFVSVRPSDPDTGKPVGRGRYHLPLVIAERRP